LAPITFEAMPRALELTEKSHPALRAIAQLMQAQPGLTLLVGVKPQGPTPAAAQEALNRSTSIVLALRALSHRDDVAEGVSFTVVAKLPGAAATGIGFGTTAVAAKRKSSAKP
jgi:hypothetical protein